MKTGHKSQYYKINKKSKEIFKTHPLKSDEVMILEQADQKSLNKEREERGQFKQRQAAPKISKAVRAAVLRQVTNMKADRANFKRRRPKEKTNLDRTFVWHVQLGNLWSNFIESS